MKIDRRDKKRDIEEGEYLGYSRVNGASSNVGNKLERDIAVTAARN